MLWGSGFSLVLDKANGAVEFGITTQRPDLMSSFLHRAEMSC